MSKTGIDSISYYVPRLYLDIRALAAARAIEPDKLTKGLGLEAMALMDTDEDTATMAAEAVLRLIRENDIDPRTIGRLYLGTESALDAAKPTATYVCEILEQALEARYGARCLRHCDALDMTFACVGAVDALHNSLEWVRGDASRRAMVVASDFAKYALASPGEYTQGAGAVAMLVSQEPRLLSLKGNIGVGMCSVGDFYKPHRAFSRRELLSAALRAAGAPADGQAVEAALGRLAGDDFWGHADREVLVHRDEPVFDGPMSNECYCERIAEALEHLAAQEPLDVLQDWDYLAFHQPYAYQGRRMAVRNWVAWMRDKGLLEQVEQQAGMRFGEDDFYRAAARTPLYRAFVAQRIEPGERASSRIGNLYTGSIFMSLVSLLRCLYEQGEQAVGRTVGCLAYGSGSKSKVFALQVESGWKERLAPLDVFSELAERQQVDFDTYQALHTGALVAPSIPGKAVRFVATGDTPTTVGLRRYAVLG